MFTFLKRRKILRLFLFLLQPLLTLNFLYFYQFINKKCGYENITF